MSGIGKMIKQAKKMHDEMTKVQEEVAKQETEITAGGGMVTVRVTGNQHIIKLKIDPKVVDPDDVEMLEDLITAAVNQAIEQSQKMMQDQMEKITGGLKIPGLGF